jgi:hypothetical protein
MLVFSLRPTFPSPAFETGVFGLFSSSSQIFTPSPPADLTYIAQRQPSPASGGAQSVLIYPRPQHRRYHRILTLPAPQTQLQPQPHPPVRPPLPSQKTHDTATAGLVVAVMFGDVLHSLFAQVFISFLFFIHFW